MLKLDDIVGGTPYRNVMSKCITLAGVILRSRFFCKNPHIYDVNSLCARPSFEIDELSMCFSK